MDLWNRQGAVNVDPTKRSEDQRHEAVKSAGSRIRKDRRGSIALTEALTLREKETERPA
jgi:hypothetical protein